MRAIFFAAAVLALAACSEPNQEVSTDRHQPDVHAWEGKQSPYTAAGWTPGDKQSWEKQLRNRGQYQNEYNKIK